MTIKTGNDRLGRFGFGFGRSGVHAARTMMLGELSLLLSFMDDENAGKNDYLDAVENQNRLGKRSDKTRKLTARHLAELYSLDPNVALFRNLRYFWKRDPEGRPLLALLCACSRDSILRSSAPFILDLPFDRQATREEMEKFIDNLEPERFSKATLKSTAQNVNSTWTQSGHLKGKVNKIRTRANATPGSLSYALLLGYIKGARGRSLFRTEHAKLLDRPEERLFELAEEASMKGWIVFKRVGDVVEALFPALLTPQETEWIGEQN
jgi:hypothetical protein